MKTIVLLGFLGLLILFLSWRRENLAMEIGNIDFGPNINMQMAETFLKVWSPIKEKADKIENTGSENFTLDTGPKIDPVRQYNLSVSWEPDSKEFEKIQRKIDKNEDKRDTRKKAIACAIDLTQGQGAQRRWFGRHTWLDFGNYAPWKLTTGEWGYEDWYKEHEGQCKMAGQPMTQYTAALKCALDNNNDDDLKKLMNEELNVFNYLQKRECQGYYATNDMFI